MKLTDDQLRLLIRFQKQEITGNIVYNKLADREKNDHNRHILHRIAEEELQHYKVYKKLTGKEVKPNRWQIFLFKLIARTLGLTFAIKLMEKNEANDQIFYARLSQIPEIPSIIADEEKHEQELVDMLNEEKLVYMGSVVLGLNDALVELTGALAGFTFALQNPGLIALTGLITGIAAAFSMAASEYLSTKSEDTDKHAGKASLYTGIAYLITVAILILPYLLIDNVFVSLGMTLSAAILIIAAFNYFYAIVRNQKFIRRFGEMAFLSMGIALLSFGIGLVLRHFFGIDV